jgi:hypothetical protein
MKAPFRLQVLRLAGRSHADVFHFRQKTRERARLPVNFAHHAVMSPFREL